jgi:hypothetical protein
MANRVPVTMLGCLMWTPRLFDYLDPEEGRIYNDVVRRIGSVSKNIDRRYAEHSILSWFVPLRNRVLAHR